MDRLPDPAGHVGISGGRSDGGEVGSLEFETLVDVPIGGFEDALVGNLAGPGGQV